VVGFVVGPMTADGDAPRSNQGGQTRGKVAITNPATWFRAFGGQVVCSRGSAKSQTSRPRIPPLHSSAWHAALPLFGARTPGLKSSDHNSPPAIGPVKVNALGLGWEMPSWIIVHVIGRRCGCRPLSDLIKEAGESGMTDGPQVPEPAANLG
jgi:hypothetical protein